MSNRRDLIRPEVLARSPVEALAAQFSAWERRGRGWQVWPGPVRLEPPFRPFYFHGYTQPGGMIDNGRRPGLLGRITGWLEGVANPQPALQGPETEEDEETLPVLVRGEELLAELQIALPASFKSSRDLFEEFLFGLSHSSRPLSFELIGRADEIIVQLVCAARDRASLRRQMAAYFPEAAITEEADFLERAWREAEGPEPVIVDFGLSEPFMLPLRTVRSLEHDPLIGLSGTLADLEEGEIGVLQILFTPARAPWAESIFRSVTDEEGRPFFSDSPQMVAQAREKIARPLYAAVIRVGAQSPSSRRAWEIAQGLGGALGVLANHGINELVPLTNDDYDDAEHEQDMLGRTSCRSGMLLNSDELFSLVHLPSAAVRTPKLQRETKKTKAAPALAASGRLVLGENTHNGRTVPVMLDPDQRRRHMHVIGASGTGKSTFLLNMILQDIEQGAGMAVLDPHGDLIDAILARIPESRAVDVVLLDPSDEAWPVGFNILSAHSELEKNLLASDLAAVFRRLSTNWGDQMNSVLGNAILAFLESERGGTLADLRRFLVEKDYREEFLRTVRDREVVYYWQKEFPLLSGKPQGPLLTRLDIFLRPKLIRYMVAQKENKLDFAKIMNGGQILLAKLAQGAIGEENAYLLGTLLVSKFHQLALSRQEIQEAGRRDFYLYIDEFHNFVTPSMASILSGARKYRLGLILAHQEMRQLGQGSEVAGAVLANPYARVCFRLGDEDARKLADGFAFYEAKDLQNLGTGEALARLERAEYDFNLKTHSLAPVDEAAAVERQALVIRLSRQRYGTAREQVEAELERNRPAPVTPAAEKGSPRPATPPEPLREEVTAHPEPKPSAATPAPPADHPLAPESEPEAPPTESTTRARPKPRPPVPEPAEQGRGGRQHKYLQQMIKQWAEGMGWRAEIEKQILAGAGSVDVALEKGKVSVACEVSVTTGVEQEVGNIEKCLKAGFGFVVALTTDAKQIGRLREAATRKMGGSLPDQVRCLTMDEFPAFMEGLEAQAASTESTVRGWKVKVNRQAVDDEKKKTIKQAIAQVFLDSLKKMKK